jgi:hypothetical protein
VASTTEVSNANTNTNKKKASLAACSLFCGCCGSGAKNDEGERLTGVVVQNYGTNGAH